MDIRPFHSADWPQVWAMLEPIFRAGETYAYAPDITKAEAHKVWIDAPLRTFVAEDSGQIIGTYYLKPNQPGLGAHVCNCGYAVAKTGRGKGVASAMCEHSQQVGRDEGFRFMQYNLVASSNTGAVRLWQKLGFDIVGTLPGAFNHTRLGLVDAHVMYKDLTAP